MGIELVVLLLIAYEVRVGVRDRRREKARRKFVEEKREMILRLIDGGRDLRRNVPPDNDPDVVGWIDSAVKWETDTFSKLQEYSARAAGAFNLAQRIGITDNLVYLPNRLGYEFIISGHLRMTYQRLATRLSALNEIMEKADIYF